VIQERPDLVVASVFTIGAMIAAQGRGIPFDMLLPNVYPLPAEGIPPFGLGLRPARGPLGRVRDRVAHALMTGAVDRYTRDRLNAVRSEHGLAPLSHAWDQIRAARRQLVMTSPAFDFPGRLPSNARYVGPVLDDPAWAGSTGWSVPPGEAPLILVGLSSTFQDQVATLQRIVDGLATCPVRALVTTGPALDPSAVRGTDAVSVVGSAPHREVLPHARLVITHGGHGTLLKALAAGCPVVVLPHGRDQADNAVRVTERGAGVALSRRASAQDVARAVAKVLGDPSYARAAAALGAAVRHDAETSTLVAELEDLDERSPSGR
jgi:MGT family glycosyltransferase